MNTCLNCGEEFDGRSDAKFCSPKCRVANKRNISVTDSELSVTEKPLSVTEPEISVTDKSKSVTDNLTFMGVSLNELDEYFKIGDAQYCELLNTKSVFHRSELPFWLLEGNMDRDSLPFAKSVFLKADEVRRRFRDMMLKFDLRFGARKNGELIAMGEM